MKKRFFDYKSAHFVGIGGVSMSALAQYLHEKGCKVSGSDVTLNQLTDLLQVCGVEVWQGHHAERIGLTDACVFTSAVKQDDEEIKYCKEHNIPLVKRERLLGSVFNSFGKRIAVSGTHGKTTTTGMIATALTDLSPTAFVGGVLQKKGNYIRGQGDICIAEACEYRESFLNMNPTVAVILNVEPDHMDYYKDLAQIRAAFNKFAGRVVKNGYVVVNGDSVDGQVTDRIRASVVTFGFDKSNCFYPSALSCVKGRYAFDVYRKGKYFAHIQLAIPGRHNVYNALATIAVADCLKSDITQVCRQLEQFGGVERRWTQINSGVCNIVEDYAHHPSEISALIATAKECGYPSITVVFQPHTFSRTQTLYNQFVSCFDGVDRLILLPIYPAREQPIEGVDSRLLCQDIVKRGTIPDCEYAVNFDECEQIVRLTAGKDDLVLFVGAGDVNLLAKRFEVHYNTRL